MFDIDNVINRTLIYFPIFKILINSVKFIEDNNAKTAYTTGNIIGYNKNYFESLTKDEQVFTISHELMHIALKHIPRMKDKDRNIWNYATDAVINQILKRNGLPPNEGDIDCPEAINYSAEEYYEIIKSRPDCEELMNMYFNNENNSTHEYWNDTCYDIDNYDIDESNISEKNDELINEENNNYKNGLVGNLDNFEYDVNNFKNVGESTAIIDWKTFLYHKKRKVSYSEYNLFKGYFNEEGVYTYPIKLVKKSDVEILIDTSISVDDKLVKSFLRECKNIFDDFNIKVGCFDTSFYGFYEIKNKNDLDNFMIEGRGGTDFDVAVNSFTKKTPIKIIFTDGESVMPKMKCDAIWIVYGNTTIKPNGGRVFYVDPNELKVKKLIK